ncbi:hypothetical protein C8R44DRAFT_983266 [Mycena epipterygia]|nr:hypothetical protein C8R44DRAFT_983266 [Mycena epipterygia]
MASRGHYNRESGGRPNPTCWNFETNIAVPKPVLPPGRHKRSLDFTGRAICRIMHQYNWGVTDLARIFNISENPISRALTNNYKPPDNTPIREVTSNEDTRPRQIRVKLTLPQQTDSGAPPGRRLDTEIPSQKRAREEIPVAGPSTPHQSSFTAPASKKPRSAPKPYKTYESETASSYRHHAMHGPPELLALDSYLNYTPSASGVSWEIKNPDSAAAEIPFSPQATAPLPARPQTTTLTTLPLSISPETLDLFLQNVMGIDLSVHRELLLAQGLDMDKIRIMAGWSHDARQRFLHSLLEDGAELLRGKKGLSLFEIMSLESVIGDQGNSR